MEEEDERKINEIFIRTENYSALLLYGKFPQNRTDTNIHTKYYVFMEKDEKKPKKGSSN